MRDVLSIGWCHWLGMSCRRGEWVCRAAQVSAPPLSREHAGRLVLQGAFRDGVGRLAWVAHSPATFPYRDGPEMPSGSERGPGRTRMKATSPRLKALTNSA